MKKLFAILLCAALLLALPVQALAAQGDVLITRGNGGFLGEQEGIYSQSAAVGDTLYMILNTSKTLLVHKVGEAAPIRYDLNLELGNELNHSYGTYVFSDGERPLMLLLETDYTEQQYTQTAKIYEIKLKDMQANLELVCEPDWEALRFEGDRGYRYVESYLGLSEGLLMRSYSDRGDPELIFLKLADGSIEVMDMPNVVGMAQYTEGRALLEIYDYNQPDQMIFQVYNPADGSVEDLLTRPVEDYYYYQGLAGDPQTGEVYCVKGGEIHPINMTDGTLGEGVAGMPLDVYSDCSAHILTGGYYATASYQGYVVRNLHPDQRAEKSLVILDGSYSNCVNNAYYAFLNENDDVEAILTHEFSSTGMIDNMMNRDDSVDVYIVSASNRDFEAVYNRGYIAELGNGEGISDMAAHLNGNIRNELCLNGAFCVLPVENYFWLPRINTVALSKLGLTIDDVPTNWMDFMDFLLDLQTKMPQDGSVALFDLYTSQTYARRQIFDQVFSTYQLLLDQDTQAADARTMTEILKKLDQLDFAALGQPTEEETNAESYNPRYEEDAYLLELNSGTNLQHIIRENSRPLVMSLTADTPAYLAMDCSVAFINPFSKNMDAAQAYMETLCGSLNDDIRCCLRDDMNEPTLNPYHDESVASMEEYVQSIQKALDEAELADKQDLEQQLAEAQESLEETRQDIWAITEQDIAWLRTYSDNLVLKGSDWLYGRDDSGEIYDLVQQYAQGALDAERLMKAVDSKIRMMIMEGN